MNKELRNSIIIGAVMLSIAMFIGYGIFILTTTINAQMKEKQNSLNREFDSAFDKLTRKGYQFLEGTMGSSASANIKTFDQLEDLAAQYNITVIFYKRWHRTYDNYEGIWGGAFWFVVNGVVFYYSIE
jgi:hypothetical protein